MALPVDPRRLPAVDDTPWTNDVDTGVRIQEINELLAEAAKCDWARAPKLTLLMFADDALGILQRLAGAEPEEFFLEAIDAEIA